MLDKEYVDRELVKDAVKSVRGSIPSGDPVINVICNTITEKIVESVGKLHEEDVSPVIHGRWAPASYDGYADGYPVWDEFECSVCGHEHSGEDDTLTNYCPNCGAWMDLEVYDG